MCRLIETIYLRVPRLKHVRNPAEYEFGVRFENSPPPH